MLQVWADGSTTGILDRLRYGGSTFSYDVSAAGGEVSLTMPRRVQSYDRQRGLTPVFDMNLPEGHLRETLRLRFAKALGQMDDFELLEIVGRSQVGRVRFTAVGEPLDADVPFQSVDEILRARRDGGLYDYLLDQFATHSGLSGVQPKVMVRDNDGEQAHTLRTATHIVKFWNPGQFDELAANEFFCLSAARAAGLDVPDFRLADDGSSLVVKRFDIAADGTPLGFEDLCSLNGMLTAQKYNGGYEASVFRRLGDFVSPHLKAVSLEQAFRLLVLNVAIRNGDAHLKNWGVLYRDTESDVSLAPVYDLVTTTAYVPPDLMALTMNASQRWPEPRKLAQFGKLRTMLTMPQIQAVFERTADALAETAPELSRYFADSPNPEIGQAMLRGWSEGVEHSLGLVRGLVAGADLETVPGPAR